MGEYDTIRRNSSFFMTTRRRRYMAIAKFTIKE
jgi:hypothetical protein